jgi:hypothetical protein
MGKYTYVIQRRLELLPRSPVMVLGEIHRAAGRALRTHAIVVSGMQSNTEEGKPIGSGLQCCKLVGALMYPICCRSAAQSNEMKGEAEMKCIIISAAVLITMAMAFPAGAADPR